MHKLQVKVCCIKSSEEAKLAIQYGATAIGLVGQMPSGPGIISDDQIHQIASSIQTDTATFLLTSHTRAVDIISHHKSTQTNTIQMVDKLELDQYAMLRQKLPKVKLVQVIHVRDEDSIIEAKAIAPLVDYVLLDSGNPKLTIKELGGTGRTHNWLLSKEIVSSISTPVFLAGGLRKSNVVEAIKTVQPYGVDLCSGLRTAGKLDEQKLKEFFEALKHYL